MPCCANSEVSAFPAIGGKTGHWHPLVSALLSDPCDDGAMARAWIELPAASGWADIRLARHALHELAYVTAELRGTGPVMLRLSGSKLETGELWRSPGQQ